MDLGDGGGYRAREEKDRLLGGEREPETVEKTSEGAGTGGTGERQMGPGRR